MAHSSKKYFIEGNFTQKILSVLRKFPFEGVISINRKGDFNGTLKDAGGTSKIEGHLANDSLTFIKRYDENARRGVKVPVTYHFKLNNSGGFYGEYEYTENGTEKIGQCSCCIYPK